MWIGRTAARLLMSAEGGIADVCHAAAATVPKLASAEQAILWIVHPDTFEAPPPCPLRTPLRCRCSAQRHGQLTAVEYHNTVAVTLCVLQSRPIRSCAANDTPPRRLRRSRCGGAIRTPKCRLRCGSR
jgi:hypothetical protein